MNELKRHQKSDKIKWVITGVLFVLLFVFLAGLCMQLFAKDDKYKPSEWFKKPDTEQNQPDTDENKTPETAALSLAASRSFTKATALSDITTYSNGTYSSLGVSLTDSEISNLEMIFGSLTVVSNSINVSNNINGNTITGALVFDGSVGGVMSMRYTILLLPKVNVFADLSYCNFESVVVQNSSGTTLAPNTMYLQYYPENFYVYAGTNATIKSCSVTYNLIEVNKPVPLPPDPVKEGHTFVGWYLDSGFTERYDGRPIFEDTALYAKFEINKFVVSFNSDGGSSVSSQTVNWNTAATLTTPTRAKYAFKGWYLPNGTQYTNQPIKENTTLTARWERNVFNVTFVVDGGSSVDNTEVNLNSSIALPTTIKTGYTFKGWFMADGTQYTNQPVTTDITLTAHWEINHYTVTFYVDGEVYSTKTVEHGSQLLKVASEQNLVVMSVYSGSPDFSVETLTAKGISTDLSVIAAEMNGTDKVVNTIKNDKWAIIGGVAGGVALIAVLGAIIGGTKRRKR